jgi:hypothetical protein
VHAEHPVAHKPGAEATSGSVVAPPMANPVGHGPASAAQGPILDVTTRMFREFAGLPVITVLGAVTTAHAELTSATGSAPRLDDVARRARGLLRDRRPGRSAAPLGGGP